ncbi:MAG TPA: MFS transporter [Kineosporiaceae bacterium]|nr:MFS transporter [Kineosporiaceae bacterium]
MATPTTGPDLLGGSERRREQRAWYFYDWANSAYVTTTLTALYGPYLTVVAKRAACPGRSTDLQCPNPLHVLGVPVSPGSLSLYAVTAATLISAVLLPIVGAVVDRSGHKRSILGGFAWPGAAAACALFLVQGANWQLGVVLQLFASLMLGCSLVVYDSILCDIATPDERDGVSSRGWAIGYLGGGLLLAVNLVMVTAHGALGLGTETAVRLSLLSAGAWWAGFTLIPFLGLRDRPAAEKEPVSGGAVAASFGQLWRTLSHLRGYPQTLRFLLAYLFFNDGVQTVIYAAAIFGQEELGFTASQLMITILLVQFVAFFGALAFGRAAARVGAWRAVLGSLVLWCLVVAAGYLMPAHQFAPFLVLASLIGIVLGGTQALSRSLYSQLVPHGREAEYFSLYQSAERGTSWLGTLLFGLLFQLSGSYRTAIVALVVFFVVGGLLLSRVDVPRGIREAGNQVPEVV